MTKKYWLAAAASSLLCLPLSAPVMAQSTIGTAVAPTMKSNSAERPIHFAAIAPNDAALVILTQSAALPSLSGVTLSSAEKAQITRTITDAGFDGAKGKQLSLRGTGSYPHILLIGTGPNPSRQDWRVAGGTAARELESEARAIAISGDMDHISGSDVAAGFGLGQYRYDRYRVGSLKSAPTAPVTIVGGNAHAAELIYQAESRPLIDGSRLARDLANSPPNVTYPETFVSDVRAAFQGVAGVTIEVMDEAALRKLNMGALLGVGQGSPRPPRLMVVRYRSADAKGAPIALVGKGITFDSGGLSIKGGDGMVNMKADMTGAASVMGAALSLAKSRAPVDVVAVASLAENMPDGNAQRPSDVVRTFSGKTIEMVNADAEGRMVLADANEYVAQKYRPRAIVNIGTLTGAVVSAIGNQYAGLFARQDATAEALLKAGEATGERLWRLPLEKAYLENLKSDIADIRNSSSSGGPGAILGALFIENFVEAPMDWAHLDIAGTFRNAKAGPMGPQGMNGYGVRLLDHYVRNAR